MFFNGLIVCILFVGINGDVAVKIPGDFVIGALLKLRETFDPEDETPKCERIREVHGMQKLEAAMWTIDMINNNTKILPGVTLGMQIHDMCWPESAALAESLDMVQGNIIDDTYCSISTSCPKNSTLIGVIGPDTSEQTVLVQNFFKLFRIPQIGYNSDAPELSDKNKYCSYFRVRPSDTSRSVVIRDILKKFNWTYIAIITSKEHENLRLRSSFLKLTEPQCVGCEICIPQNVIVQPYHDKPIFRQILNKISRVRSVSVVICFCNSQLLRGLFEAMKELNFTHRFTFIVSDFWEDFDVLTKGVEKQAWGTISVNVHTNSIKSFSTYYQSLKPSVNTRNPMFNEFWEQKFDCELPTQSTKAKQLDAGETIDSASTMTPKKSCTGKESLAETYQEYQKIGFLMKAIWAIAFGLHSMMNKFCGANYRGVCSDMYPFNHTTFLTHFTNLSFPFNNEIVTIRDDNSLAKYDIVNFQQISKDTFTLVNIGNWKNGSVNFYSQFQSNENRNVSSRCSQPCPLGNRKVFIGGRKQSACCWQCESCEHYYYVSKDKKQCIECDLGEKPNALRTGCDVIPVSEHDWTEPLAILIITFSVIGLIGTHYTLYIFIKYKNTPVVKASNRDLCYVILFGMLLAHLTVFIALAPRSSIQCAGFRIFPAISGAAMFAGLFIKTYRISKILGLKKNEFPSKQSRLMSASAQVAMTFVCIGTAFVISSAMLVISPPEPTVSFWTRDRPIHSCLSIPWTALPPMLFTGVLQCLCIIYGIKTRNIPGKFNESKFIGFAMLITFIISVLMIVLHRAAPLRSHIVAAGMNFNALVIHIFLFVPKLYIIVLRPEKNVRTRYATTRGIRTHMGARVDENTVESYMEHSPEHSFYDDCRTPEYYCRLRKSVGIQTELHELPDISHIGQDNDAFLDDDEVCHRHDCGQLSSESE